METCDDYTISGLKTDFADTLDALKQYLRFQESLGNKSFELSVEAASVIDKWGTSLWRHSQAFSCQGPESASLMIVDGEACFFDGPAGGLLVKILKAMHLAPDRVFICSADDGKAIRHHVQKHTPKCLLCLGEKAGRLVNQKDMLTDFRGQFLSFENIPVMVTHHPCELLDNPGLKRCVWDDVQQVMTRIGK